VTSEHKWQTTLSRFLNAATPTPDHNDTVTPTSAASADVEELDAVVDAARSDTDVHLKQTRSDVGTF